MKSIIFIIAQILISDSINIDKEKKFLILIILLHANAKNKNNNDMISKDQKFENKIISNKNYEKSNNILGKNNTSLEFN